MTKTDTLALSPRQIAAIQSEIDELSGGSNVQEIRVRSFDGATLLVTADAGYGTYSFYVRRDGHAWQAELGATV